MNNQNSEEVLELDYIHFRFFDAYVFSTIQDGVSFTFEHLKEVAEILNRHYKGAPFVSIALRNHDYTIAPTCFLENTIIEGMLAIGVVCYSESAYNTSLFERTFYKGTYEVFYSLEKCVAWAKQIQNDHQKNAGL